MDPRLGFLLNWSRERRLDSGSIGQQDQCGGSFGIERPMPLLDCTAIGSEAEIFSQNGDRMTSKAVTAARLGHQRIDTVDPLQIAALRTN